MAWYAARTVYLFGKKRNGKNVFEERVVAFEAQSWEEVHAKASEEARRYAQENEVDGHPDQVAYKQDGSPLIDGYEIWSDMFEASATLDEFYAKRYANFEYRPDGDD